MPDAAVNFSDGLGNDQLSPPSASGSRRDIFGDVTSFGGMGSQMLTDLELEQWLSMPLDFGLSPASASTDAASAMGKTSQQQQMPSPFPHPPTQQMEIDPPAALPRQNGTDKGKQKAVPITCGSVGGCGAQGCCLSGLTGGIRTAPVGQASAAAQSHASPGTVPSQTSAVTPGAAWSPTDSNAGSGTAPPRRVSPLQAAPASSCASSSFELVLPPKSSASSTTSSVPALFPLVNRQTEWRDPMKSTASSVADGSPSLDSPLDSPSSPVQRRDSEQPAQVHPYAQASSSDRDRPQCTNCESTRTPLWRRDPENKLLCNACGLYLKLHKKPRPKALKSTFQHHPDCVAPISHPCQTVGCQLDPDENAQTCANCGTSATPLWRRDENGNPNCNACGLWRSLHGSARPVDMRVDHVKKRKRGDDKIARKASIASATESVRSASAQGVSMARSNSAAQSPSTPAASSPAINVPAQIPEPPRQQTPQVKMSPPVQQQAQPIDRMVQSPPQQTPTAPPMLHAPSSSSFSAASHLSASTPPTPAPASTLASLTAMGSGIPIIAHPTPMGIALQCPHTGQAWFFPNAPDSPMGNQPQQHAQAQFQSASPVPSPQSFSALGSTARMSFDHTTLQQLAAGSSSTHPFATPPVAVPSMPSPASHYGAPQPPADWPGSRSSTADISNPTTPNFLAPSYAADLPMNNGQSMQNGTTRTNRQHSVGKALDANPSIEGAMARLKGSSGKKGSGQSKLWWTTNES